MINKYLLWASNPLRPEWQFYALCFTQSVIAGATVAVIAKLIEAAIKILTNP